MTLTCPHCKAVIRVAGAPSRTTVEGVAHSRHACPACGRDYDPATVEGTGLVRGEVLTGELPTCSDFDPAEYVRLRFDELAASRPIVPVAALRSVCAEFLTAVEVDAAVRALVGAGKLVRL